MSNNILFYDVKTLTDNECLLRFKFASAPSRPYTKLPTLAPVELKLERTFFVPQGIVGYFFSRSSLRFIANHFNLLFLLFRASSFQNNILLATKAGPLCLVSWTGELLWKRSLESILHNVVDNNSEFY